jgi:hypothetical protein
MLVSEQSVGARPSNSESLPVAEVPSTKASVVDEVALPSQTPVADPHQRARKSKSIAIGIVAIVVLSGVGLLVADRNVRHQTSSTTLGVVPSNSIVVPAYDKGPTTPSLGTLAAWVEFTYKKLAGTRIHVTEIDLTISNLNPHWATFYVRATNADMSPTYAFNGKDGWRADNSISNSPPFLPDNLPHSVFKGTWTSTEFRIKGW